jgi:hypothetical protein
LIGPPNQGYFWFCFDIRAGWGSAGRLRILQILFIVMLY